jgi:hypothetical protein
MFHVRVARRFSPISFVLFIKKKKEEKPFAFCAFPSLFDNYFRQFIAVHLSSLIRIYVYLRGIVARVLLAPSSRYLGNASWETLP